MSSWNTKPRSMNAEQRTRQQEKEAAVAAYKREQKEAFDKTTRLRALRLEREAIEKEVAAKAAVARDASSVRAAARDKRQRTRSAKATSR
jgi:hypothetical protein